MATKEQRDIMKNKRTILTEYCELRTKLFGKGECHRAYDSGKKTCPIINQTLNAKFRLWHISENEEIRGRCEFTNSKYYARWIKETYFWTAKYLNETVGEAWGRPTQEEKEWWKDKKDIVIRKVNPKQAAEVILKRIKFFYKRDQILRIVPSEVHRIQDQSLGQYMIERVFDEDETNNVRIIYDDLDIDPVLDVEDSGKGTFTETYRAMTEELGKLVKEEVAHFGII